MQLMFSALHMCHVCCQSCHMTCGQFKRFVNLIRTPIPTLLDFDEWLEYEVRVSGG